MSVVLPAPSAPVDDGVSMNAIGNVQTTCDEGHWHGCCARAGGLGLINHMLCGSWILCHQHRGDIVIVVFRSHGVWCTVQTASNWRATL